MNQATELFASVKSEHEDANIVVVPSETLYP